MLSAEHTTAGTLGRNYLYLNGKPLALLDSTGTLSYILNDQVASRRRC
jgi:hypothetical protein